VDRRESCSGITMNSSRCRPARSRSSRCMRHAFSVPSIFVKTQNICGAVVVRTKRKLM
jgi:hypothetical protein